MPEALAVLIVLIVSVVVYFSARLHAANPANYRPAEELQRLEQQNEWLTEKLSRAERENWGTEMHESIRRELEKNRAEKSRALQKLGRGA
jgi:hypothetical protein